MNKLGKFFLNLTLIMLLSALFAGCTGETTSEIAKPQLTTSQVTTTQVTSTQAQVPLVKLNIVPKNVDLEIGGSIEFQVECFDSQNKPIQDYQITWKVAQNAGEIELGKFVAGIKAGTYDDGITATVRFGDVTLKDTASITIKSHPVEAVSIKPFEIEAGATKQIDFDAVDEYGNPIEGLVPIWSLTNKEIATITHDGRLTAGKKAGQYFNTLEVKVKQGTIEKTAKGNVTIIPGSLEQIGIAPEVVTLGMGKQQQFAAIVADKYGNIIPNAKYNWVVKDSNIGTFSEDGIFKASLKPGTYKDGISVEVTIGEKTLSKSADIIVEPDRIVFLSDAPNRDSKQFELWLMDADGNNISQITHIGGSGVNWQVDCSQDGRRIAFTAGETLYVANSNGEWMKPIFNGKNLSGVSWSPDGKKIAFDMNNEIYVVDADGTNMEQLTQNPADDFSPSWSPDGKKIVFVSSRDSRSYVGYNYYEIYIMNADGSNEQRLTMGKDAWNLNPKWSRDGKQIIFESDRGTIYYHGIYVMNADGSNINKLYVLNDDQVYNPSVSPDGSRIAFDRSVAYNDFDIWVVNVDGSNVIQLTDKDGDDENDSNDYCPTWLMRKSGVDVSTSSIPVIDTTETLKEMTISEITAFAKKSVVLVESEVSSGSGFIIDPNGIIVTCNHVISDAHKINVQLENGVSYVASVLSQDKLHDIAVLKIDASGLPFLKIVSFELTSLGQQVIVLGYSLGNDDITVTSGLVSAIKYDPGRNTTWIQTDSAVNPGNSGAPLLNLNGDVIGMVSSKLVGELIEGIGYAISSQTLNLYLPGLLPR